MNLVRRSPDRTPPQLEHKLREGSGRVLKLDGCGIIPQPAALIIVCYLQETDYGRDEST
jgi:hypothetical protein